MNRIGTSDLEVFPLCLGGNVFGWTSTDEQSFATLDAFVGGGGNFIDTADMYSSWVPGHVGGESETILGRWMQMRGNRHRIVLGTKVGKLPGFDNLLPKTIRAAADNSLKRLQTDHIDLYYAHRDDDTVPLEETLGAFDALVREGKVRYVAASNYTAPRLTEALAASKRDGLARYVAVQPHYNLVHRQEYEGELAALCAAEGLSCAPYFSLARGFLTGKYRPGVVVNSPRSAGAAAYLNEQGLRILGVMDDLAAAHKTSVAAVGLAWLKAQPTVVAPIAGAGSPAQVAELLPMARLQLSAEDLARLSEVSAPER